jgi:aminomethyltransferase
VDFAGFEMPLRYTGDVGSTELVRTKAGLFDISHMGEFRVRGTGAVEFLDRSLTNDVAKDDGAGRRCTASCASPMAGSWTTCTSTVPTITSCWL